MRDILCRGFGVEERKWIYGYAIWPQKDRIGILPCDNFNFVYEVEEKSFGQYVGLNDKNGKKIFEGDYLKCTDVLGDVDVYEVRWTNEFEQAAFRLVDSNGFWNDFKKYDGKIEVVGNVYDSNLDNIKEEVYNAKS